MTKRLSLLNFNELPSDVLRPQYDFQSHKAGIVHMGIGAFHRGHQAVFTDDAIAHSGGDWRIIGVSLRSPNVSEQMNPQSGLYTVTTKAGESVQTRLIASVEKVMVASQSPSAVIETIASPNIKVITLTVTEKGYHYNMAADSLLHSKDIQHDIANIESPVSMPGYIVAACLARMKANPSAKLSIISCDNLPHNGVITRKVVTELAALVEGVSANLLTWIEENVSFCSSMVDRIVPAVTEQDYIESQAKLGLQDKAMINTETFKQWVIEDNFCTPTPNWQGAGALLVENVETYEKLKLRTLNGSHSALAYMGVLLAYKWIHEAVADPTLFACVEHLMQNETGPSLSVPNGFDLLSYQQQTLARFQNSNIRYATQQVAMDGSQKLVQRIFLPLADSLQSNDFNNRKMMIAVIAAWCKYLQGKDEAGNQFEINDPHGEMLHALACKHAGNAKDMITELIQHEELVPRALANSKLVVGNLIDALDKIELIGLRAYLESILAISK